MPNFDTPQPITAVVEIAAGSVRLVASDRDDTVVEVRPRDESRGHDVKAAEQVRVDFTNGRCRCKPPRLLVPAPGSGRRRHRAAVRLAAPRVGRIGEHHRRRSVRRLQVRLGQRRSEVGSVTGNLKADTASGGIAVRVVKGSASVSTASGDATYRRARRRCEVPCRERLADGRRGSTATSTRRPLLVTSPSRPPSTAACPCRPPAARSCSASPKALRPSLICGRDRAKSATR